MDEVGEIVGGSGRRFVNCGEAFRHDTLRLLLLLLFRPSNIIQSRSISVRIHVLTKKSDLLVAGH